MFLLVDIILIASIVAPTVELSRIPQKTIDNTVEVLKSRGIEISPEIIPHKRESLGVAEVYNLWPDKDMLAKKLLGKDAQPEGEIYKNGTKELRLNQSDFKYENTATDKNIAQELIDLGIDAREHIYEQGEKSMRVWQAIEDRKIFESEIYAAENGGTISVSGYWIFADRDKGVIKNTPDTLLDVTGVLIDFANNPVREEQVKIASVEIGYSTGAVYRDTSHKLVSVSPAYKISTDTGDYYMYDAFSGSFLYAIKNGEIIYG